MKIKDVWIAICRFLCLLTTSEAAKILAVFPVPAKSNLLCHEAIMESLHNAGHEVTIITPFPNHELLKNYKTINSNKNTTVLIGQHSPHELEKFSGLKILERATEMEEKFCKDILQLSEVQDLLQTDQKMYDVMFINILTLHQCFFPLAEKLNVPIIGTVNQRSWLMADECIGNPRPPGIVPFELNGYSDKMTFIQRLMNTWDYILIKYHYYVNVKPKLRKIHHEFYTSNLGHEKKVSLIFYNNHPSIMPRNLVPNAIEIGGVHVKPAKPLPKDLQDFIDSAEHGVILFTLGSVMKASDTLPEVNNAFKNAFARIRQRVVWKLEEQVKDLPANVLQMKWVPQRDILAHKNVKAFITHCGISGTYEAVYEGVPLVLTPVFGDQRLNAAALEKSEVGVYLDLFTATADKILNALNAVINETRYYENMQKLSHRFKDRPSSPAETVVYWTNYVIKHKGAPHLRVAGAEMSLLQYLLIDVILFIAAVILLIFFVTFLMVKKIYKLYYTKLQYTASTFTAKKQK